MSKPIVLFGTGKIAEVVHHLMVHEAGMQVAGFTVDAAYVGDGRKEGLPVVDFASVEKQFAPDKHDMFVALGYHEMNGLRARKIAEAKAKGYAVPAFIHPQSGLPKGTPVGENSFIMRDVHIHPKVSIGNDVFVWSGAIIGHHSTLGDHVWITSGANIAGACTIGDHCFFAINSTISHGVTIGRRCFIGANALVTKDMTDEQVVIAQADKPIRLNTDQFLRMSAFSNI
jgi:sugar O-acyltransferase (sialic acid O-acetyltransferase NeuD family)